MVFFEEKALTGKNYLNAKTVKFIGEVLSQQSIFGKGINQEEKFVRAQKTVFKEPVIKGELMLVRGATFKIVARE